MGFRELQPIGQPIKSSTHVGFNCPPITSGSCGLCPLSCLPLPERQSLAFGVGSMFTAVARFMPCLPASCDGVGFVCLFSLADALGVGHIFTT